MAKPTTEIDLTEGKNILLTWVAPYDNSDVISEYALRFLASDGLYYETSDCLGTGTLVSLTCSVPMLTLRASPFKLSLNTLVKAIAKANNTNGFGDLSEANTTEASI